MITKILTDNEMNIEQNDETTKINLFIGVFPCGIVCADKSRRVGGDYVRCACIDYETLTLEIEKDCSAKLREIIQKQAEKFKSKQGQKYPLSTSGQCTTLGYGNSGVCH